jgi:hypothetical protein
MKETLEEAAESKYGTDMDSIRGSNVYDLNTDLKRGFVEGAKWQQERMYSEAIEFAEWIRIKDFQTTSKNNWIGLDMKYYTTQELFEQFKKK